MSLQTIIDSAVNIEINRTKLIAQSISRSGRILTASRNWVNPYRIKVTPKPIWTWSEYRDEFEAIFNADRITDHNIYIGLSGSVASEENNPGSYTLGDLDWMVRYRGSLDSNNNLILDNCAITSWSGTAMTITYSGSVAAGYMVRSGDWIRPRSHDYAYQVVNDVTMAGAGTYTITTHRGRLTDASEDLNIVKVGSRAAKFKVRVVNLPNLRFNYKDLVEFNGGFELFEVVE